MNQNIITLDGVPCPIEIPGYAHSGRTIEVTTKLWRPTRTRHVPYDAKLHISLDHTDTLHVDILVIRKAGTLGWRDVKRGQEREDFAAAKRAWQARYTQEVKTWILTQSERLAHEAQVAACLAEIRAAETGIDYAQQALTVGEQRLVAAYQRLAELQAGAPK